MTASHSLRIAKAWHMRAYLQHFEDSGVRWQRTAKLIGLPARLPGPNSFLPSDLCARLLGKLVAEQDYFEMSAKLSLLPDGQLRLWDPTQPILRAAMNAPSLYSFMQTIAELAPTQWSSVRYWVCDTQDDVWLCSTNALPNDAWGNEQIVQGRIAQTVAAIEQYLGQPWRPEVIRLETQRLPSTLLTDIMEGARIDTNCKFSAIQIPRSLAPRPGPVLRDMAVTAPSESDESFDATGWNWVRRLQAILPEYILGQCATCEQIANVMNVNSRTLQRGLQREGLTFRSVVDNVRLELARQYLADSRFTIEDVGRLLGYSEPTNFTRAFRRVAGCSPQQYRIEIGRAPTT